MKTKLLCEILDEGQMIEIGIIIDHIPPAERLGKLKSYLSQFRQELELKGVDSDYLAYSVEYYLTKQPQQKKGQKHEVHRKRKQS